MVKMSLPTIEIQTVDGFLVNRKWEIEVSENIF